MIMKITLGMKDGVAVKETPDGGVALQSGSQEWPLRKAGPGTAQALLRLAAGGATREELEDMAREDWFFADFSYFYEKLCSLGWITWSVEAQGQSLARLEVIGAGFEPHWPEITPEQRFMLSRFAYSRRLKDKLVAETPLQPIRLELAGWLGAALWGLLAHPLNMQELSGFLPGADAVALGLLLQLFCAAGLVQAADGAESGFAEDRDQVLKQWEFHDLLFHARSRHGRHDYPAGATLLFQQEIAPLPARKPDMPGEVVALYRPDLTRLKEQDRPFTAVLEARRSLREYAAEAVTADQVGEFLYRAARVQGTFPADPSAGHPCEISVRPYPGGGACHALEIYLTVGQCRGLTPGLYHYDPYGHRLTRLSGENRYTRQMLEMAKNSTRQQCATQVLVNITARFQRLAWKYSAIAYRLVLKDLGGLYQTMYLVAEAMGLAPCTLGGGHADLLCRAAGLNYPEESPVGEFLLGSRKPE